MLDFVTGVTGGTAGTGVVTGLSAAGTFITGTRPGALDRTASLYPADMSANRYRGFGGEWAGHSPDRNLESHSEKETQP